jgi:hypothetical protein
MYILGDKVKAANYLASSLGDGYVIFHDAGGIARLMSFFGLDVSQKGMPKNGIEEIIVLNVSQMGLKLFQFAKSLYDNRSRSRWGNLICYHGVSDLLRYLEVCAATQKKQTNLIFLADWKKRHGV